jgi:hypothetical protein
LFHLFCKKATENGDGAKDPEIQEKEFFEIVIYKINVICHIAIGEEMGSHK